MNLIFIGPPGSGKGTQSDILEKSFNIKKLSTGDILRKEVADLTPLGEQIKFAMEEGQLISDEIMISIISNALEMEEYKKGFILDGFPRTLNQAIVLAEMFREKKIILNAVIELKVSEQSLIDRISGRFTCSDCGASYNNKFNHTKIDGVCDKCGSKNFIHRKDDNIETLMHRVKTFYEQADQLIPYYKSLNILYSIDGMRPMQEVTKAISLILKM